MRLVLSGWTVSEGAVLEVTPREHGRTTVRYVVDSASYTITTGGYNFKTGDTVNVYVSNYDSRIAMLDTPHGRIRNVSWISTIAAVSFPTILIFGTYMFSGKTAGLRSNVSTSTGPAIFFTGIALAMLVGLTSTIVSGQIPRRFWLTTSLAMAGALILCIQSWIVTGPFSWAQVLRSKTSIIGLSLIALAAVGRFWP